MWSSLNQDERKRIAITGGVSAGAVGVITLLCIAWKLALPAAIIAGGVGALVHYRKVRHRISEDVIAPGVFRRTWQTLIDSIGEDARVIGTMRLSLKGALAKHVGVVADALRGLVTLVQNQPESTKDALQVPHISRRLREELQRFVGNGQPQDAVASLEQLFAEGASKIPEVVAGIRTKDTERMNQNTAALKQLL